MDKKVDFRTTFGNIKFLFFRSISLTVSSLKDLDLGKVILGTQCTVKY